MGGGGEGLYYIFGSPIGIYNYEIIRYIGTSIIGFSVYSRKWSVGGGKGGDRIFKSRIKIKSCMLLTVQYQ